MGHTHAFEVHVSLFKDLEGLIKALVPHGPQTVVAEAAISMDVMIRPLSRDVVLYVVSASLAR